MSTVATAVPENGFALGKHMTVEYYECDADTLSDPRMVEDAFLRAARDSGATVIGSSFHRFDPQGVSGFVVIAESHFSVHAWPEFDYAAVDIFTCGESIDFQVAAQSLKKFLKAGEMVISAVMNRGITNNNGLEKHIPVQGDKTHLYSLSWKSGYEKSNANGLSCNIDIYGGDPVLLGDRDAITRFADKIYRSIPQSARHEGGIDFNADDCGDLNMSLLRGAFRMSGRFLVVPGSAYLDVFSSEYYEPREVAESALAFFKGLNYRMQVALRR